MVKLSINKIIKSNCQKIKNYINLLKNNFI